jgi:DNA invertase Pin-like site-specific DNA recombinase
VLELALGRERRSAAREAHGARGHSIGRPKALDASKAALAQRMRASGESATTIATALGVSRATVYSSIRRRLMVFSRSDTPAPTRGLPDVNVSVNRDQLVHEQ